MTDSLSWWRHFRGDLSRGGFRELEDTPSHSAAYASGHEASCPDESCDGVPEYHDFARGDEYLAFILCPVCGGVWGAGANERFH